MKLFQHKSQKSMRIYFDSMGHFWTKKYVFIPVSFLWFVHRSCDLDKSRLLNLL